MNPTTRGSSQVEPTIRCSLRSHEASVRRIPAWLEASIIIGFFALLVYVFFQGMTAEDRREALQVEEHKAMAKTQSDGWDLNPDGTLADTPHNRELQGKK